jgi:hypothetical protein
LGKAILKDRASRQPCAHSPAQHSLALPSATVATDSSSTLESTLGSFLRKHQPRASSVRS